MKNKINVVVMCEVIIEIVLAIILSWKVLTMGILPNKYIFILWGALVAQGALTVWGSRIKGLRIPLIILEALVIFGITLGFYYISKADEMVNQISDSEQKEKIQIGVYVKMDSPYTNLDDLAGKRFAYTENDVYSEEVMEDINRQVSVEYLSCEDIVSAARSLMNNEVDAFFANTAFIGLISELEEFEAFSNEVRVIYYVELDEIIIEYPTETSEKEQTETTMPDKEDPEEETIEIPEETEDPLAWLDQYELTSNEESLVIYISGIDTWGNVNIRQNGDVNIIAVVNTKTGKIQLINTPRDYYIYLPNSGGVKDKLTHAGCYGVDISVGALEMLYGIKIDYYLKMNFSGFERIIDTLGGIDVYSEYDFVVSPIKHYYVGTNHLNGIEALAFARERKSFALGDIQRGKNQMAVIKATIRKMESSEMLYHFADVLNAVSDCIVTSIPTDVIYGFVKYQLETGKDWEVESYTVTGANGNSTTFSMPNYATYVMIPNEDEVYKAKQMMEKCLNGE